MAQRRTHAPTPTGLETGQTHLWTVSGRSISSGYAVGIGSFLGAASLRLLSPGLGIELLPAVPFWTAIVVSTSFGGLGPGLLTTALSFVFLAWTLSGPPEDRAGMDRAVVASSTLFLGCGVVTCALIERSRRSERLQAAAVRLSEAHLAEAQRIGHIGSWAWNPATGECHWSAEHFRIFGLDPATFTPTQENTQRMIHPEDLSAVERTLGAAIRERRDFDMQYRIIRPDGSIRHHRGLGHPVVNDSATLTFVGMVHDITDRALAEHALRRSEAYLADGQRLSHTGSWALNASTRELFWSLEHFRICGLDPETFTLTVEAVHQLIHPDDRTVAIDTFDRAVREATDFDLELRFVRPDGTSRVVHSLGHPVFDESGHLIEYVGTAIDVTERKQQEAARSDLLRRLIAAQESERRRISREMHDELGQDLSAFTLRLGMLRRQYGEDPALDAELSSLQATAKALDHDVDFIVWQLRPTTLDDLGLVGALEHHLKTWSEYSQVAVEWHSSGIEAVAFTDEIDITLYRILQEALTNIAKHARATRVEVILEARPEHVSLIVEDNGFGFDTSHAFGRDQRGLGLIGMKERVSLLAGTVDIESRPGDGTTLVARIPVPQNKEGHR